MSTRAHFFFMYSSCLKSILRNLGSLKLSASHKGQCRSYKSLSTSITIPNVIFRIKREEAKMKRKATKITDGSNFATFSEPIIKKVTHLQNYLGEDKAYYLENRLAVFAIHPYRDKHIELKAQPGQGKIKISSLNLIRLGEDLLSLECTMFVLRLKSENSAANIEGLNLNLLEDKIYELIQHKNTWRRYINASGLLDATVCPKNPYAYARRESAKRTLYIIIGLLSFQHGERVAKKFIQKKIIQGENGLMEIVLKKLSK